MSVTSLSPSTSSNLVNGTICKYLFRLPDKGGPNDYIIINTTTLSRANGYISITKSYVEASDNQHVILNSTNKTVTVKYPYQAFVTVFGNSVFKGDFQFKY